MRNLVLLVCVVAGATPYMQDPLVRRLVSVSHSWERSPALRELKKLAPERQRALLPLLVAALADRNEYVRQNALTALGALDQLADGEQTAIQARLKDPEQNVRAEAAVVLASMGHDSPGGTVQLLVKQLRPPESNPVRLEAALALGRIAQAPRGLDVHAAVLPLIANLKDPDDLLAAWSAAALGDIGDARAVPGLTEATKAPEPMHGYATSALEQIHERAAAH